MQIQAHFTEKIMHMAWVKMCLWLGLPIHVWTVFLIVMPKSVGDMHHAQKHCSTLQVMKTGVTLC